MAGHVPFMLTRRMIFMLISTMAVQAFQSTATSAIRQAVVSVLTESAEEQDVAVEIASVDQAAPAPGKLRFKRYAGIEYSVLIPQLKRPEVLDGSHAGDLGFDPMGFAKSPEELYSLMESEVRHCRLAMLCAAGWPMSELRPAFDGALLADGGRAPSVLNGHLFDSPSLLAVLAFFAEVGNREIQAIRTSKKKTLYGHIHSLDYAPIAEEWPWGVAGDLSFDPFGLYGLCGKDAIGRKVMRDLEINHGRVAMLAVLGYVVLEKATGRAVVDLTPWLFANF